MTETLSRVGNNCAFCTQEKKTRISLVEVLETCRQLAKVLVNRFPTKNQKNHINFCEIGQKTWE